MMVLIIGANFVRKYEIKSTIQLIKKKLPNAQKNIIYYKIITEK
jgi:ABC-type uncharacterized transport system substrate-binding protein